MFFEVATSRGPILIDNADAELVAPYNWYAVPVQNNRFYAHARIPGTGRTGKRIMMHRFITGAPKGLVVHHRNNNGLDNRRENLEITTHRQNTKYSFANRSTGVHFDAASGKWRVAIRASLGMYSDEAEAREIARVLMEKLEEHLVTLPRSEAGA